MKNKYFHELTTEEFLELVKAGTTYKEIAKKHPQPKWCKYPEALNGVMGCWNLTGLRIKKEEDCKNCDQCIKQT